MRKNIMIFFIFILLLLPNTMFAAQYSEDYMENRETITINGVEYIGANQPVSVEVRSTGIYSTEAFQAVDGTFYPAGTPIFDTSTDGTCGNTTEYTSVTIADTSIEGRGETNDMLLKVLAEPVINNGEAGADYPNFQIQEYLGDICKNAQEYYDNSISEVDRIGMTLDEMIAYSGYENTEAFEEYAMAFYNEVYGEILNRIPEYDESGFLILKDVGEGIKALTGINDNELAEWVKKYSVNGDGEIDIYEIVKEKLEELIEEEDGGNQPQPPAGQWSDSQAASVSASVSSDKYDVELGIPTSENLNGSISASDMSWSYNIIAKNDSESATVNVTLYWEPYTYTWTEYIEHSYTNASGEKKKWYEEKEHSETRYRHSATEAVTGTYTTHYFSVQNAQMNKLTSGSVSNDAVGTLATLGAASVGGSIDRSGGIKINSTVNTSSFSSYGATKASAISSAQGTIANRIKAVSYVENDKLTIKSTVLKGKTDVGKTFGNTPYIYPSSLNRPSNSTISNSGIKMIPSNKPNDLYESSASATYTQVSGFDGAATYSKGASPSSVYVHTPVVNRANITYISDFVNQKINIDGTRTYLMLDEMFTITIPDDGTHRSIRGYYNRTYNTKQGVNNVLTTWGKQKDVRLPFDTYLHYSQNGQEYKHLLKANTWISEDDIIKNFFSATNGVFTFTIPVWVTEKTYNIETRVIAENAESSRYENSEEGANLDPNNYVATKTIPVEVIGKIYDLRVSSTDDPGWASIYSWKNKTPYIAADEFPFGAQGQNRNTAYKYAPKLGYTFVFDFKTKGTKSNNIDVSVQPEGFYFVSRDGSTTQEVDLYYNTTTKKNIKIGSTDDKVNLNVRLIDAYLKVAAQELTDSTRIYNNKYNYGIAVNIGTFAKMNMPHSLRLCYNNFAEYIIKLYGKGSTENSISTDAGAKDTVIGSVGHWYAGYRLPASTKAVPITMDINTAVRDNSFLTDGYIVVKFGIKTKYKNDTGNYEYLQYMGPEAMNEAGDNTGTLIVDWTTEGNQTITLPNGNPAQVPIGSVAIFDASLRSSNDLEVAGTH